MPNSRLANLHRELNGANENNRRMQIRFDETFQAMKEVVTNVLKIVVKLEPHRQKQPSSNQSLSALKRVMTEIRQKIDNIMELDHAIVTRGELDDWLFITGTKRKLRDLGNSLTYASQLNRNQLKQYIWDAPHEAFGATCKLRTLVRQIIDTMYGEGRADELLQELANTRFGTDTTRNLLRCYASKHCKIISLTPSSKTTKYINTLRL
jgi:hypothetical protein